MSPYWGPGTPWGPSGTPCRGWGAVAGATAPAPLALPVAYYKGVLIIPPYNNPRARVVGIALFNLLTAGTYFRISDASVPTPSLLWLGCCSAPRVAWHYDLHSHVVSPLGDTTFRLR